MKKHISIFSILLLLALVLSVFSPAAARGRSLTANLYWGNVVPEGSGDPNGFGGGTIYLSSGQQQVCFELMVFFYPGFFPANGAFIHQGAAGENGPVVIDLGPPIPPPGSSTATGCVGASSDLIHAINQNPSNYYLQITNETHPDGAIRGQLMK